MDRRKFIKYGIIGAGSFLAATVASITLDTSQGFKISEGQNPVKLGVAEAQAAGMCGFSNNCSGGGGKCGFANNCSGSGR